MIHGYRTLGRFLPCGLIQPDLPGEPHRIVLVKKNCQILVKRYDQPN